MCELCRSSEISAYTNLTAHYHVLSIIIYHVLSSIIYFMGGKTLPSFRVLNFFGAVLYASDDSFSDRNPIAYGLVGEKTKGHKHVSWIRCILQLSIKNRLIQETCSWQL